MSDQSNASIKPGRTRRTLQSGFSLMSRGEPKIWITGGMLVVCLTMVVGLMSLIVINGLATFWPRPTDWLVLSTNEMDIGEPQRTEVRSTRNEDGSAAADDRPGYFYRTANFDITNRHYRWFSPDELDASGIVRPEWAMLVERMSWGRMIGLPARLSIPFEIDRTQASYDAVVRADQLLKDLVADSYDSLVPMQSEGDVKSPTVDELTAALVSRVSDERTVQLKSLVQARHYKDAATIQIQAAEGEAWQTFTPVSANSTAQSQSLPDHLWSVRRVWDDPQKMLAQIEPELKALEANRRRVAAKMHAITQLDERLAAARIAIRQAELDTGRIVLNKVEEANTLFDAVVHRELMDSRIASAIDSGATVFADESMRDPWRKLLESHRRDTLQPALVTARAAIVEWLAQFAQEPPAVKSAIQAYIDTYRLVAASKQPLEEQIREIQQYGEFSELVLMVPTAAATLELSEEDARQLQNGHRNAAIDASLAAQQVVPDSEPLTTVRYNEQVSVTEMHDANRGRVAVWCIDRTSKAHAPASADVTQASNVSIVCLIPAPRSIPCNEIVRLFPANRLSLAGKWSIYGSRWAEFLFDDPREANTEGGVFPAIWGTIVMTLIMTLAVVPFGVIAALYLREYTRSGPVVSMVRISINNLAGVPSIVYGVFGLAFFCYSIGAFIDGGAKNAEFGRLPTSSWYTCLAATVVCGVASFMISLFSSGPEHTRTDLMRVLSRIAPWMWLLSLIGVGVLVFKSPFFDGFYEARLPAPTFGKEGLLWASLTLALLTLPVVIVATEEALSAVPNSLREGSLACGASKWQTIYRIVLPHARPGILTGAILAMARGIGEVAPLMLVGALPVAPDLPLDTEFPYFHGSRSFMHLGYQIYWLGFQSQNSEASKPLVFTCTLLLILIVVSLNLSAILLRARLRRRFQGNQF